MQIHKFYAASPFIRRIITHGYDQSTDIMVLATDIMMTVDTDVASAIHDYRDVIINIIASLSFSDTQTTIPDTIPISNYIISTIGIQTLLKICDELCLPNVIDSVLRMNTLMHNQSTATIINHTLSQHDILRAYANGHNVLVNIDSIICYPNYKSLLTHAINNGMYINNISMHGINILLTRCHNMHIDTSVTKLSSHAYELPYSNTNTTTLTYKYLPEITKIESQSKTKKTCACAIIQSCDNLEEAIINHQCDTIHKFPPTLKKISLINGAKIPDDQLKLCTNLCELYIDYRFNYLKPIQIPKSLTRLTLFPCNPESTADRIINDCIKSCTNIKSLHLMNATHITTCNSFAKSLRKLNISDCGIGNKGLARCTNLRTLYISGHCPTITTCYPFHKSLKKLVLRNHCDTYYDDAMTNDGLKFCTKITYLDITSTSQITTCEPFAKSLTHLEIASGTTGITNHSIRLCTNITYLDASNNYNITTCEPFANTLKTLIIDGECGIKDKGLSSCKHIEKLHIDDNYNVTTCIPFADSLRILHASLWGYDSRDPKRKQMDDSGLTLCKNITHLYVYDNDKITTCAPFAQSIVHLEASGKNNGINNAGIALCANLTYLDASYNTHITTCKPFAKSLRTLYTMQFDPLLSPKCIDDAGLKLCTNIEHLYMTGNKYITTCAPFCNSLKTLEMSCGITDACLKECVHLEKLILIYQNCLQITTIVPNVGSLVDISVRGNVCQSLRKSIIDVYGL